MNSKKTSVFILHNDDDGDFEKMNEWLDKWNDEIHIKDYSTGGWEHCWDIKAPANAVDELPKEWICESEWANS